MLHSCSHLTAEWKVRGSRQALPQVTQLFTVHLGALRGARPRGTTVGQGAAQLQKCVTAIQEPAGRQGHSCHEQVVTHAGTAPPQHASMKRPQVSWKRHCPGARSQATPGPGVLPSPHTTRPRRLCGSFLPRHRMGPPGFTEPYCASCLLTVFSPLTLRSGLRGTRWHGCEGCEGHPAPHRVPRGPPSRAQPSSGSSPCLLLGVCCSGPTFTCSSPRPAAPGG